MKFAPFLKVYVPTPASFKTQSIKAVFVLLCVIFCAHVHRPNHYIQITSQFSVFWIFRHFCNHSPQSLHNNNLEIFVFAIFGNFVEISRPNVRKLRGHSVLWFCTFTRITRIFQLKNILIRGILVIIILTSLQIPMNLSEI